MGNCNTHDLHSSAPAEPGSGVEAVFARHLFWPESTRTCPSCAAATPFILAASYSRAATEGYVIRPVPPPPMRETSRRIAH